MSSRKVFPHSGSTEDDEMVWFEVPVPVMKYVVNGATFKKARFIARQNQEFRLDVQKNLIGIVVPPQPLRRGSSASDSTSPRSPLEIDGELQGGGSKSSFSPLVKKNELTDDIQLDSFFHFRKIASQENGAEPEIVRDVVDLEAYRASNGDRFLSWMRDDKISASRCRMLLILFAVFAVKNKESHDVFFNHLYMFQDAPNTMYFDFLFAEVVLTNLSSHFFATSIKVLNEMEVSNQNDNLLSVNQIYSHDDEFVRLVFGCLRTDPTCGRLLVNNDLADNKKMTNLAFLTVSLCKFVDHMEYKFLVPTVEEVQDMVSYIVSLYLIPILFVSRSVSASATVGLISIFVPILSSLPDSIAQNLISSTLGVSALLVYANYCLRSVVDGNLPETWFKYGARSYIAVHIIMNNPIIRVFGGFNTLWRQWKKSRHDKKK